MSALEAITLCAALVIGDDRPPMSDRDRLPSLAVCCEQNDKAERWLRDADRRIAMSPSREHLVRPEREMAARFVRWWSAAVTTMRPMACDSDRDRMALMRGLMGAEAWDEGDWPWLEE